MQRPAVFAALYAPGARAGLGRYRPVALQQIEDELLADASPRRSSPRSCGS